MLVSTILKLFVLSSANKARVVTSTSPSSLCKLPDTAIGSKSSRHCNTMYLPAKSLQWHRTGVKETGADCVRSDRTKDVYSTQESTGAPFVYTSHHLERHGYVVHLHTKVHRLRLSNTMSSSEQSSNGQIPLPFSTSAFHL